MLCEIFIFNYCILFFQKNSIFFLPFLFLLFATLYINWTMSTERNTSINNSFISPIESSIIPSFNKMSYYVTDNWPFYHSMDVMPAHSWHAISIQLFFIKLVDIMEVNLSFIYIITTRIIICMIFIFFFNYWMFMSIISSPA